MKLKLGDYEFEVYPKYLEEDWKVETSRQKVVGQFGEDQDLTGIQPVKIRFRGTLLSREISAGDLLDIEDELRQTSAIVYIDQYEDVRPVRVVSVKARRVATRNIFNIELVEIYSNATKTLSANFIVKTYSETLSANFIAVGKGSKKLSARFVVPPPY